MPNIIITSPDANGHTDMAINGIASRVPHNKKVSVSEAEMEVLNNAVLGIATITVLEKEDAEVEAAPIGGSDPKAGTEGSAVQAPATPAATSSEPNPLLTEDKPAEPRKPGEVQLVEDADKGGGTDDAPAPAKRRAQRKPAAKKADAKPADEKPAEGDKAE